MKMGVCVKLKMLVSAICVVILLAMTGCKKEMYTPDEPVVDRFLDKGKIHVACKI